MNLSQMVSLVGIMTSSWTFAAGLTNHMDCPRIMTTTTFACHGKLRTANELLRYTSPNTTLLDISQNFITSIRKNDFGNLAALVTMNLSHNAIEFMESGAFDASRQLVTLDLSHNKLRIVHSLLFYNLNSLERLLLAGNFISQIPTWNSEILPALNYLDLASTPLICDCGLSWLSERMRLGKLKLSESTSCFTPSVIRDRKFSSLDKGELTCSTAIQFPHFAITPAEKQIIVPGDSFRLECSATNLLEGGGTHMAWIHNGVGVSQLPIKHDHDLSHEKGLFSASIEFVNVTEKHAGNWSCHAWTSRNDERISTELFVLHDASPHCPSNMTVTTRGTYWWPKTFAQDVSVELPCEDNNLSGATVKHVCDRSGRWRSLDVTNCPFRTEFERVLKEYIRPLKLNEAVLASGLLRTYLLNQSASQVVSSSERLDLVLQAVEAVMHNQTGSAEILSDAAKIADWVMDAPFAAWQAAKELQVSQRLMKILISSTYPNDPKRRFKNYVTAILPAEQQNSRGTFCEIFSNDGMTIDCFEGDHGKRTIKPTGPAVTVAVAVAAVSVPAFSLPRQLLLFAFRNVKSFAALVAKGDPVPSSLVIGVFPRDSGEVEVPQEIFTVEVTSPLVADRSVPLYLSPSLLTQENNCNVVGVNFETGATKLACNRFGLMTITQPFGVLEAYHTGALPSREIPIFIYTCAAVTILVHILLLLTYASYFISLALPRLYKHCLLSLWLAVDALVVVFVCGFTETHHQFTCIVVGVVLHYLTLCCLLWVFLSFYILFKSTRKSRRDPASTKPDSNGKNRPNVGGFYLFGWGVPLILTGISAAVYTPLYASQRYCYLRVPHSLLAIVLPSSVIALSSCLLFILLLCLKPLKRTHLDPENNLFVRGESQGMHPAFDAAVSNRSHAVSLFLYWILFLVSYFVIGSWAGNGFVGTNQPSDWKSVHEYGIGISLLLFSLVAICVFWLFQKDLPKTCWAASKKVSLKSAGNRTVLPVQESLLHLPLSHSTLNEMDTGRISADLTATRVRNSAQPVSYAASSGRAAEENAYSFQNGSGHAVSYASSSAGFVTMVSGPRRYSVHRGASESSKMETCI